MILLWPHIPIDEILMNLNTIADHAETHPKVVRDTAFAIQRDVQVLGNKLKGCEILFSVCRELNCDELYSILAKGFGHAKAGLLTNAIRRGLAKAEGREP